MTLFLAVVLCGLFSFGFRTQSPVEAATGINEQVNYQGRLLTSTGAVVPDGTYNMEFQIIQDGDGCNPTSGTPPCGGTVEWTETRTSGNKVTVKNGYFSVYLGSVTPFSGSVDWNQDTLWLSVNIGGTGSPSWDGEMEPFNRLSATPYALNSKSLGGLVASNFVQLAQGSQTDATTLSSIYINKTGASGNILELEKNGADVFLLNNTGAVTFQNTVDSTTGFQVLDADGGTPVFNVDTTNERVGIGDATPDYTLDVGGTLGVDGVITAGSSNTVLTLASGMIDADALTLVSAVDGRTGTSSASGMAVYSDGLSLLQGCSNGQSLAWVESTDTWDCTTVAGTGANTALSNLASVAINTALLPGADNTIDLGSGSFSFRTGYIDTSVLTPLVDTSGTLSLGTGSSTATSLGKTGTTLTVNPTAWTATPTISGLITATSGLTANGTLTTNGTLTANGVVTLGDGGDTVAVNSSDWDISTAGALTGISGISNDGAYTQTGSSANTFSGTSTFSNSTTALVTGPGTVNTSLIEFGSSQTSGTILMIGGSATLSSQLTAATIDLDSNYTTTNQNAWGLNIIQDNVTNTSGSVANKGIRIDGSTATQTTGGSTAVIGADIYNANITQTAGTLTATGLQVTTGTITTGGTQTGLDIIAQGVGTGSLRGVNIGSITGAGGSEIAVNFGTGWDTILSGTTAGTSLIDFTNFDVSSAGALDVGSTITAGSSNTVLTLSTGMIDGDALTLIAAADGGAGTSSGSGLVIRSDGVGLLQGCTDGQVLSWVESTDTWDCSTPAGGGANTALSNLSAVAINTALLPGADNTIDLGSGSFSFRTAYIDTSVLTPLVDTSGALSLGTGSSTATNLGKTGTTLTVNPTSWTATPTISGLITATSGLTANGTVTTNGALTANGVVTLGDNGDTVAVNSSDWDISTTGDLSGIGTIASNGKLTISAGGEDILLNGATSNRISWGTTGIAAPTFTSYSAGVKAVLYDSLSGSDAGYTLGVESNAMFFTVASSSGKSFKWYGGTTEAATLSGTGNLDAAGTLTAGSSNTVLTLSTGMIDGDALTLVAAADGGTGTSSGSGLVIRSDGVGLLQGCSDGQVLTWVESTDTWDCGTPAGSGANTALSNLSAVAINTALLPGADNTIDLGSGSFSFRTAYIDTSVLTPLVDTSGALSLGTGSSTSTALGKTGTTLTINPTAWTATPTISGLITATSGVTANGTLTANAGVVIGDASGDTVTVNSGAWTFANDTTVALSGGVNGINFDSDTLSIDATNNRVGIGTAAPANSLTVNGTADIQGHASVGSGASVNGGLVLIDSLFGVTSHNTILGVYETNTATGSMSVGYDGLLINNILNPSGTATYGQANGMSGFISVASGNAQDISTAGGFNGFNGGIIHGGSGTISGAATGLNGAVVNLGGGTIDGASGLVTTIIQTGGGTINTAKGVNIATPLNFGGTITNSYGLYVNDHSGVGATDSYNIYSAGASSENYFEGALIAGSSNTVLTLSTGMIDGDALTLVAAADGGTGTSSGSGLVIRSDGVGLLQGCSDGQVLAWVESTDTWDCATPSGSGANTALSNLSAVAINTSLLPGTDDSIDLGDNTHRFRDLYLGGDTLHIGTSTTDEGTISYDTTGNILNFSTDATTNADIAFFTDDLYLDKSSGNVGIGDTSPSALFTVGSGDLFRVTSSGLVTMNSASTNTSQVEIRDGGSGTVTLFVVDSSNDRVYIGDTTADTTGVILVLDDKTGTSDPASTIGGSMYYNSGLGSFRCYTTSWVDCGGANTALSNLSGVAINTSLLPGADNTIDLGSGSFSFRTAYLDTSVLTPLVDTSGALSLGTGSSTATNLGKTGTTLTINPTAWTATPTISGLVTATSGLTVGSGSNTATLLVNKTDTATVGSPYKDSNKLTLRGSGYCCGGSYDVDFNVRTKLAAEDFIPRGFLAFNAGSGADLFTLSQTGAVTFQPTTDRVNGFQILDTDGGTPILNVDYTNERVGLGTAAPGAQLTVFGGTSYTNIGQLATIGNYSGLAFGLSTGAVTVNNYSILGGDNNTLIGRPSGGELAFRENNVTQMNIATGGAITMGNTSTSTSVTFATQSSGAAGVVAPNVAPEATTTTRTQNSVDTTNDVGQWTDTAIGSDGFPVISYYDVTNTSLRVTKCGNAECSSGNTSTTVDNSAAVGQYTSIAVPADGLPVVAFYDATGANLMIAKCGNTACSSGNTVTTVDSTGTVGAYTSIAIGRDGFPVVAYLGSTTKVLKCSLATCASSNTITTTGVGGNYNSIAIGTDGYPVISSTVSNNQYIIKCTTASCSSSTSYTSAGSTPTSSSIAIRPDGRPVAVFLLSGSSALQTVSCIATDCSSAISNTATVIPGASPISLAFGADGYPIVSYYYSISGDLKVLKCANYTCATGEFTDIAIDTTNTVGEYSSIAIGRDGYPFIAYYLSTSGDLRTTKCANQACSSQSTGMSFNGYGVDLGTDLAYFRRGYFANLYAKTFTVTNFDLAEQYQTTDGTLSRGEIVTVDPANPGYVKRAHGDTELLGIVSTEPGLLLGEWTEGQVVPIALAGRVPLRINDEGGPIAIGDKLTQSSVPGVARKAAPGEETIATALAAGSDGTIEVFVRHGVGSAPQPQAAPGLDNPAVSFDVDGNATFTGTITADKIVANKIEGLEILTNKISRLESQVAGETTEKGDGEVSAPVAAPPVELGNVTIESATITLDMNVSGMLFANGGLKVDGPSEFMGDAIFNSLVSFIGPSEFTGDANFAGRATFNNDSGGFAVIQTGKQEVKIVFDRPYAEIPVVSLTNKNGQFVDYAYKDLTKDGFTIILKDPATADVEMSWTALSVKQAKVTVSP